MLFDLPSKRTELEWRVELECYRLGSDEFIHQWITIEIATTVWHASLDVAMLGHCRFGLDLHELANADEWQERNEVYDEFGGALGPPRQHGQGRKADSAREVPIAREPKHRAENA